MDIIGIQGSSPGAGKDTAFEIIKEYAESKGKSVKRIAFGDKLKILALKALGFEGEDQSLLDTWDEIKYEAKIETSTNVRFSPTSHITLREYVQNFGQELKKIDPDIWINAAEYPGEDGTTPDVVVYTDVRFQSEAQYVSVQPERGSKDTLNRIYIDARDRQKLDSNQDVEGWYDDYYIDIVVWNNGTPEEFKEKVIEMLEKKYDW